MGHPDSGYRQTACANGGRQGSGRTDVRRGQGYHNDAGHTNKYRTLTVALTALQVGPSGALALLVAVLLCNVWLTDSGVNFSLIF
jgi:hypothetical protein